MGSVINTTLNNSFLFYIFCPFSRRRKARIETVLLENEKNTARENANLAKLKDNLALCTIQDGKLSLLDNKMPEFMERVESNV